MVQSLLPGLDREFSLSSVFNQVRRSLELQDILRNAVLETRRFLQVDRVMIYQFHPDESGEVVAEAIDNHCLPSLLGLNFPADDIPPHARELFLKVRQRSVVQVETGEIGLSPLICEETKAFLENPDVYYRQVDPCHLQYLKAMGVQSSLAVPIVHYDLQTHSQQPHLWGLLVSHHIQSHHFTTDELQVVQFIADQLAVAIAQARLLDQVRQQSLREATVNRISNLLHSFSTIELQLALQETVGALQGIGGRLYIATDQTELKQLYCCGAQPHLELDCLHQLPDWQDQGSPIWAISDIQQEPLLQSFLPAFESTSIRGILIAPLQYRQQVLGYLTIFRQAITTSRMWAGEFDPDQRQTEPRKSFLAWCEHHKDQAPAWTDEDLELSQAICQQFVMAVQHYLSYNQMQRLNLKLEQEVQKRTQDLQQMLNSTRLLNQVTDQIRSTLDLQKILQTIVHEVRHCLSTDRVVIYQFTRGWQGEIVVEDVVKPWHALLGEKYADECFPREHAQLYGWGRIRAVNDVETSDLRSCHKEFLRQIQVQANLVVPIRMGTQLWGLLIAHECRSSREWQAEEIDLLQQLAGQAAIAIHQAELYEQSRQAAAEATAHAQTLEQTLQDLQQTQTQLIQSEKMSSLGQLVAGVAHEINNPVNFIYGNLSHATEYTQNLIQLIELYQQQFPEPGAAVLEHSEAIELDYLLDDLPKILASMKLGADRIRQIVTSLRNFSRLDQAEMKAVDIHEGIDSTLMILQHRLKPKSDKTGMQVIKNYGQLPEVECYAGQLNQVFMNILVNAIEALEDSPGPLKQIQISTQVLTSAEGRRVVVQIRDTGSGMPEAVRSRIFDPFFTTKPVGRGTGLGLSISYQIVVNRHHGVLRCDSAPGQGTEFWIEIPVTPPVTP